MKVLVPYRGIYFLYPEQVRSAPSDCKGSRPLSGNLFSLRHSVQLSFAAQMFSSPIGESIFSTSRWNMYELEVPSSRPLSGNLFSLHYRVDFYENGVERFSSPIGESIFSTGIISPVYVAQVSSRPLSGNLFSLQE